MATDKSIRQLQFNAAVKVMEYLPGDGSYQPSQEMLRMFYSYYKQATVGPCDAPQPSYWDTEGRAKWEAWRALGNMTKEAAMMEYVQEIKQILEILPVTEDVSELLDVLGNFYEFVDDDGELSTSIEFIKAPHSETAENLVTGNVTINEDYGVEAGDEGDDEEDEEKEEQSEDGSNFEDEMEVVLEEREEQCVEPTGPVIDVTGWRGGSPASVENSSSCLSNDTHSSLDTQDEDEELGCSQEEPTLEEPLCCVDEHLTNDYGVASGQNLHSQASDNEVNCDSSEHPAPEEGATVPRILLAMPQGNRARRQSPPGENKALQCGNQEPNPQFSPPYFQALGTAQPSQSSVQMEGSGSHGTEPCCQRETYCKNTQRSKTITLGAINKDVAIALTRLQADMQDVLQRLNTLEAQKATQTKSLALRQEQLMNEPKKDIMVALQLVSSQYVTCYCLAPLGAMDFGFFLPTEEKAAALNPDD